MTVACFTLRWLQLSSKCSALVPNGYSGLHHAKTLLGVHFSDVAYKAGCCKELLADGKPCRAATHRLKILT